MARKKGDMPKRTKTYDLILKESMALFNEFGVESVSIYRVAEAAGISTGNLTYYFKRKKDLISAHLKELDVNLVQSFEHFPYVSSARKFVKAYVETFSISWQYRFLFNSAPYLIQNELVDTTDYQQTITDISASMVNQTKKLIEQGHMKPIREPYSVETLVDCIWWQWLGWLRANQLRPVEEQLAFNNILINGITHMLFITHLYMKPEFVEKVHQVINENLTA